MSSPPPFENKPQCHKCGVKFTIITRQHHCRNCGRSYCNACSKANIPLPHYRLSDPQRVCDECLAHVQEHYRNKAASAPATPPIVTGGPSSLPQAAVSAPSTFSSPSPPAAAAPSFMSPSLAVTHSVAPSPSSFISAGPAAQPASGSASVLPVSSSAAVRRPAAAPSTTQAFGQFSGFGRSAAPKYDLSADQAKLNDQCRDAIKNNDSAGVVQLLKAGADAKYVDHTGNSLLHLAAMFDRFDIAKSLLSAGASLTVKNPAGETPLDIAPPAMQHKLQALVVA